MSSSAIENKLKQAGFFVSYRAKDELKLQKCPLHKDRTPSLSINLRLNAYQCFSCGDKGTINKLLSYFGLDYNHKPNLEELESLLVDSEEQESEDTEDIQYNADVNELKEYRYFHPYMVSRGFTKEFIFNNQIGFDKKSIRATIPIFFEDTYYGCAKRTAIDETPKILYNSGMPKDKILFSPLTNDGSGDYLLVTEGPIDALKSSLFGQDAVAIMGCHASETQISLTKKLANGRQIVLALDNDEPGRRGIDKWLKCTSDFDTLIFNYDDGVKDIGDTTRQQFYNGITSGKLFWE
jgi:DNA primase